LESKKTPHNGEKDNRSSLHESKQEKQKGGVCLGWVGVFSGNQSIAGVAGVVKRKNCEFIPFVCLS
jgi:hypothetical protein